MTGLSYGRTARRAAHLIAGLAIAAGAAGALGAQDSTTREGVRVGLTYDPGTRPGVAVLPAGGPGGDSAGVILARDLDFGDRVVSIAPGAAAAALLAGAIPDYARLRLLGAAAAVQATVRAGTLHVALHDVAQQRVVQVQELPLRGTAYAAEWRASLHAAADEVERWITGVRGISGTRIAYVLGGRLHLVDSDGWGPRPAGGPGMSMSPAWHPGGREIAVSALTLTGTAQVTLVDATTGAGRAMPGQPPGLNITPAFAPDGRSLLFANGRGSGTDLWVLEAGQSAARRVTVGRGTDNVSPAPSPDGRRVAFTSGRSGHPEVYIADVDGTNAELLTTFEYGSASYRSNPDWSPDGRLVAYQVRVGGRFQIATIELRDRRVRQHTSEGENEDPSWAPDGRHLVFTSTRAGGRQLWVLDTETGRVRQLTRAPGARLAAWSPTLAPIVAR